MTYRRYGREREPEMVNAKELYRKAINYEYSDVNKLNKHNTETIKHFLAKATVFYLLRNLKHDVITGFSIEHVGKGDILDLSSRDQYEIETQKSIANINRVKKKYINAGIDLIIIQIRKMPMDIDGMRDYLKEHIRP